MGNSYSEDPVMHILLDSFHKCRKYTAHKSSHEAELRREEKIIDQKCLSFLVLLKHFSVGWLVPPKKYIFPEKYLLSHCFYHKLKYCQDLNNKSVEIK